MNDLKVLYYFDGIANDEMYIEVKNTEGQCFWFHVKKDTYTPLKYLAHGKTIGDEKYWILQKNGDKILMTFDNYYMRVSGDPCVYLNVKPCEKVLEKILKEM